MKHLKGFNEEFSKIENPKIEYKEENNKYWKRNPSGGKWVEINKYELDKNCCEPIDEKKKMNAGFKAYLDKQKAKKSGKSKDGDKEEDKKDKSKVTKGLTAAQRKLPKALQDSILRKKK